MSMEQAASLPRVDADPQRFFWYGVWALVMVVSGLPLLGIAPSA